jgi:phage gpG-like protein
MINANENALKLKLKLANYKIEKPKLVKAMGILARDHFRLNFKKQGFDDSGVKAWKKRSFEMPGKSRSVLTQRGKLRDSIEYRVSASSTIISSRQPYARIHNDGGTLPVTRKMRSFFWAMYYQAKGASKQPNAEALIWRNMAMKKGNTITIPQRQFMGHSQNMNKKIDRLVKQTLKKI